MRPYYLFEFCDVTWLPAGIRECLYEMMESCHSGIRSFNRTTSDAVLATCRKFGLKTIVEVGAGRAPLTRLLAQSPESDNLTLVPCDLVPNVAVYRSLESQYPGKVRPIYDRIDLTQPQPQLRNSLISFVGVMHHIPLELRPAVISSFKNSDSVIMVNEPLRRTWYSLTLALLSVFVGLWVPIARFRQPGKLRRFFWCWLVPVAPLCFTWDAIASCLRQWTPDEWRNGLREAGIADDRSQVIATSNSLSVQWSCLSAAR